MSLKVLLLSALPWDNGVHNMGGDALFLGWRQCVLGLRSGVEVGESSVGGSSRSNVASSTLRLTPGKATSQRSTVFFSWMKMSSLSEMSSASMVC